MPVTAERNARRLSDAQRVHRHHATNARAKVLYEQHLRKLAKEKEEAMLRAAVEQEAKNQALRAEFLRQAEREFDEEMAQREAAGQAHAQYASEERERAKLVAW